MHDTVHSHYPLIQQVPIDLNEDSEKPNKINYVNIYMIKCTIVLT